MVDFQNCFDEGGSDDDDDEEGVKLERNKTETGKKKLNISTTTVDLAGCLNRLLHEANRLEEKATQQQQQQNKQILKPETATTTKKSTASLNSTTTTTATSNSSLKDLYLLQSWLNASFAIGGGRGRGASTRKNVLSKKAKDKSLKAKVIPDKSKISSSTSKGNSSASQHQYYSLLKHFNLTSLAPNFDPVNRLYG